MQRLRRAACVLLPLAVAFSPAVSHAQTAAQQNACAPMAARMSAANLKYRATMNQLRAVERDLGPTGSRSAESVLRSVRGFETLHRDVAAQREAMLVLYAALEASACPPFDREGYEATLAEFRRLDAVEMRISREANALGYGTASR
jgi:hypothetical protein